MQARSCDSILGLRSLLYQLHSTWDVIQGLWPVGFELFFWCFREDQKGLKEAGRKEKGVGEGRKVTLK